MYGHIIEDLSEFCEFKSEELLEHKSIYNTNAFLFSYWESKGELKIAYMIMKKVKLVLEVNEESKLTINIKKPIKNRNTGVQLLLDF